VDTKVLVVEQTPEAESDATTGGPILIELQKTTTTTTTTLKEAATPPTIKKVMTPLELFNKEHGSVASLAETQVTGSMTTKKRIQPTTISSLPDRGKEAPPSSSSVATPQAATSPSEVTITTPGHDEQTLSIVPQQDPKMPIEVVVIPQKSSEPTEQPAKKKRIAPTLISNTPK
jgi:hypothetical protein